MLPGVPAARGQHEEHAIEPLCMLPEDGDLATSSWNRQSFPCINVRGCRVSATAYNHLAALAPIRVGVEWEHHHKAEVQLPVTYYVIFVLLRLHPCREAVNVLYHTFQQCRRL